MAKTVKTRYGTVINVEGLTAAQVKKVLSVAQDNGAFGTKGQALADTYRKAAKKAPTTPTAPAPPPTSDPSAPTGGVDSSSGAIDPGDFLSQIPKIPGAEDLQGEVDKSREAAYGYITKDYAGNKDQEMKAAKQELAQRGIPLDPDPNSLYGRTLSQIDKKYQGMDDQAKNQAFQSGNDILTTQTQVADTGADNFITAVLGMSQADMQKYGIDKDFQAKMKALADAKAARAKPAKSGGGGGGGKSSGGYKKPSPPIFGGDAP